MHRRWLLLPAFIISAVAIIGLLNSDAGNPEQHQIAEEEEGHDKRITVLVNNQATRQGYPVHFDDTSRKLISTGQDHIGAPLTMQDLNTLPTDAIWADNLPSGTTLQHSHILLPGDTDYQTVADIRNRVSYPLTIERQQIAEQLIHPGVRVDIILIGAADKHSVRAAYPGNTSHLSATTVVTDVLVTDVQIPDSPTGNGHSVTVMLSIAPENLKRLILARHAGVLELTPSTSVHSGALLLKEAFPHHSEVTELRGEALHRGQRG